MPPMKPPIKLPTLPSSKTRRRTRLWILDNALPNVDEVRARCLAKPTGRMGFLIGMKDGRNAFPALLPDELAPIEDWVRKVTGYKKTVAKSDAGRNDAKSNCVQVVGVDEADARPHTDSRPNCRLAAVIYLYAGSIARLWNVVLPAATPRGKLGGITFRHRTRICKQRWERALCRPIASSKMPASITRFAQPLGDVSRRLDSQRDAVCWQIARNQADGGGVFWLAQ